MLAPDKNSSYITLASLREAGFPDDRAVAAVVALFPEQGEPEYGDDDFEEVADDVFVDGDEPAEPDELAEAWEMPAYEPTEQDWAEYARIFDRIDRQPIAAMTRVADNPEPPSCGGWD